MTEENSTAKDVLARVESDLKSEALDPTFFDGEIYVSLEHLNVDSMKSLLSIAIKALEDPNLSSEDCVNQLRVDFEIDDPTFENYSPNEASKTGNRLTRKDLMKAKKKWAESIEKNIAFWSEWGGG